MTQRLNRKCWWCGTRLMVVSHAEVQTPSGVVWTHKSCEPAVREYFRAVTAQPRELPVGVVYE